MSFFTKWLGAELLTKQGKRATEEVLRSRKHVLVYLSAHWCPPCRRFTPMLAEFYTAQRDAKSFEIVFVSLDRDQASFDEYFGEMPWNAVPYEADERAAFSKKFGGEGIPELLVFTADGEVVTREGVEGVASDKSGDGFPWAPPTWDEAIGTTLLKKDGSEVPAGSLDGKTVGVYCSAHWCPPCRAFTPQLAAFYEEYKKKDPQFEIVFCSSDKSEEEMQSYFKEAHGDYLCMPFAAAKTMARFVGADGIPTFAVYRGGKLVNKNARAKVAAGADAVAADGWEPPAVADLAAGPANFGVDINSVPAVLVRVEGCDDDEQDSAVKELTKVAKEYLAESTPPEVLFFVSKAKSPISDQLTELTKKNGSPRCAMPDDEPLVLLFNIPDGGAFFEAPQEPLTADSVRSFVKKCLAGEGKRLQLSRD